MDTTVTFKDPRYGTLALSDATERYLVFVPTDGTEGEVCLAVEDGRELHDLADISIGDLWGAHLVATRWCTSLAAFKDYLAEHLIDPDEVLEVGECAVCNAPTLFEVLNESGNGDVCDSCLSAMSPCGCCGLRYASLVSTLEGNQRCNGCIEEHCIYCSRCNGYYDPDSSDHEHDCNSCESPAMEFTIRNNGDEPLHNDVQVEVSLPTGIVSEEGMGTIASYLRNYRYGLTDQEVAIKYIYLAAQIELIGTEWQTRQGNFTKRLSRHAYKEFSLKLPPEVVSQVGVIARDHSGGSTYRLAVTRDLNQPAEAFAHEDSCWWQSYSSSRCALKTNGGFGLRTFTEHGRVTGRAWVLPLKQVVEKTRRYFDPTFETMSPDAFVVFNGYGDLSGYAPARLLAHMAGMTYRKIAFEASPMYVNNDAGYMVAPEEIANRYTDGGLELDLLQHSKLYESETSTITERETSHV